MNSILNLIQKEVRQNSLIYIIPFLILLVAWILNLRHVPWMTSDWAEIIAVVFPVALAGAYGLQAFDLEENGQTRDFLLTKPLTVNQIVFSKYFSGMTLLLLISTLWLFLFLPESMMLPNITDFPSIWFFAFIIFIITTYTASFATGILINGPIKLLAAIFISAVSILWIFYTWCQFLTACFFKNIPQLLYLLIVILVSIGLLILLSRLFLKVVRWILQQKPFSSFRYQLLIYFGLIVFLPILFLLSNLNSQPAIRPFKNLMATLFKAEEWFITKEGTPNPRANLFALVDSKGKLGIAKIGQKPKIVYQSQSEDQIQQLQFSPDGSKIAFTENHLIKVFHISTGEVTNLIKGDILFWSADSKYLLAGEIIESTNQASDWGSITVQKINMSLIELSSRNQSFYVSLTTSGSSLYWDSVNNLFLAVDISGMLKLINFFTGEVNDLPFPIANEFVFYSKISLLNENNVRITLFTFPVERSTKEKLYNAYWFDYNLRSKKLNQISSLKHINYKDIINAEHDNILIRKNDNGIYHLVKLPQEVSK